MKNYKSQIYLLPFVLIFVAIVALAGTLFSCSEEQEPPKFDKGCQTGISKASGIRSYIRCCTKNEHLAGSNVANGGSADVANYSYVTWEGVANCNECQ